MGSFAAAAGAVVGTGLSLLSASYQISAANEAAAAKKRGLELRRLQERVSYQNQSVQRLRSASELLAHQLAVKSTRGVSLASPSFFAIQADTLNEYKKDEDASRLNLLSKEAEISSAEQEADFEAKMKKRKVIFDTASSLSNMAFSSAGGIGVGGSRSLGTSGSLL